MRFHTYDLMTAAIVVALDMRSSSLIFDDMAATNNLDRLGGFIASLKHFLADDAQMTRGLRFSAHKFSGDAWILLFLPETDGAALLEALRDLCMHYDREYDRLLLPNLTEPPQVTGLAFGIDAGPLFATTIFQNTEYLARALNIASRLQGEAKKLPTRFGTLISATAFENHFRGATGFKSTPVTRDLRGIRGGGGFQCMQVELVA
jgi:class 3 adenylate cyclase